MEKQKEKKCEKIRIETIHQSVPCQSNDKSMVCFKKSELKICEDEPSQTQ